MILNEGGSEGSKSMLVRFVESLKLFAKQESSIREEIAASQEQMQQTGSPSSSHAKTVVKRQAMYNDRKSTATIAGGSNA